MRKEFSHARSLAITQAQVLQAHDEIKMATMRLRVRENDDDSSLNVLSKAELLSASVQYTNDKFVALSLLSCVKGKLRYLKVKHKILCLFFILIAIYILYNLSLRVAGNYCNRKTEV